MVEIAKISGALFFLIQIAKGDVQSHGAIPHRRGVESSGLDLEAGSEAHCPFNHLPLSARLRLGHGFLGIINDPLAISLPRGRASTRLAFQQSASSHAALP